MKFKSIKFIAVAAMLTGATMSASASINLVNNGDFEAGDAGWNQGNFTYFSDSELGFVTFGNMALYGGCIGFTCSTNQTISTIAGQSYIFSFDYGSDGRTANEFIALFGDQTVFHTINDTTDTRPGYIHESFAVTAKSASTLIDFRIRNDPGWQSLDNVTVTAAVPEPETYAMMLGGLAAIGAMSRRRKKA